MRRKMDDEMLVTHAPEEPKDMSERVASIEPAAVELEADPKVLAARLAATTDPEEREKLIGEIHERLGNQEAERIVQSIRKSEER